LSPVASLMRFDALTLPSLESAILTPDTSACSSVHLLGAAQGTGFVTLFGCIALWMNTLPTLFKKKKKPLLFVILMDALHDGLDCNPFTGEQHGLSMQLSDHTRVSLPSLGYADDTTVL